MSERDDSARLLHMRDFSAEVVEITRDKTRESLDDNRVLVLALCYAIGIIGEAASKTSQETRDLHPQIEWAKIIGMRTFLFHIYFRVDNDIIWNTATISVPALLKQLEAILPPNAPE